MGEVWRIRARRDGGSGSFLCPPGHPALTHTLEGFHSSGPGAPRVTRASGPDYIGGIGQHAGELEDYIPAGIRRQADRLHANAVLVCSPDWVASVYGYFRNSYSPDGTDRNVSASVIFKPGTCQGCGRREDAAGHKLHAPLGRGETRHAFTAAARPAPEWHLGYLHVRSWFPGHAPDLELIAGRGILYGQRTCIHCGQNCQYEAQIDGWAPFGQHAPCTGSPDGRHAIDRAAG